MRDIALQAAGWLAIIVALVHGVIGERVVFARATIEPARTRLLLRLIWQAGTIAWIGGGVLLIWATFAAFPDPARRAIILVFAVIYGAGALGNAWATRGRHIGWVLMTCVVVLALAGL